MPDSSTGYPVIVFLTKSPYPFRMSGGTKTYVSPEIGEDTDIRPIHEPGYTVICWNDPVNLMNYVSHVFQKVFGWNKQKAEHHMLEVHKNGKSVLAKDTKERAEHFVHELLKYHLHATMERE
ncbi:MAG: ATP-dependent Clp protease adapter ClpS [Verrucomicrobiota bacterium]|nr:ATP-dependent Clp protease adapter ClpS [Verrucomicrobiota bacterium]